MLSGERNFPRETFFVRLPDDLWLFYLRHQTSSTTCFFILAVAEDHGKHWKLIRWPLRILIAAQGTHRPPNGIVSMDRKGESNLEMASPLGHVQRAGRTGNLIVSGQRDRQALSGQKLNSQRFLSSYAVLNTSKEAQVRER